MTDLHQASTYIAEDIHQDWQQEAEDMDVSMAELIRLAVESYLNDFRLEITPDETSSELRKERNRLAREKEDLQSQVTDLEQRLRGQLDDELVQYIRENPGAEHDEILQHVANRIAHLTSRKLDDLIGDEITFDDGQFYPAENFTEEGQ